MSEKQASGNMGAVRALIGRFIRSGEQRESVRVMIRDNKRGGRLTGGVPAEPDKSCVHHY